MFVKNLVQCFLKTYEVTLPHTEKFTYLVVTFSSNGRQDNELDTCIRKASVVMRQLHLSIVLKRELCTKAKLFVFRSVFVSILTYGHECWIMTEIVSSRVQAAEMSFLRKVKGLSLLDKQWWAVPCTKVPRYFFSTVTSTFGTWYRVPVPRYFFYKVP